MVLAQRISQEANCPVANNCKFEYNIGITPKVTLSSSAVQVKSAGDTLSFTGSLLGTGTLLLNGTSVNSDSADTDKISFTMPSLPFGTYTAFVKVGNVGYADTGDYSIFVQSALTCTGVNPSEFSMGGSLVTINGNGFNDDVTVTFKTVGDCYIVERTSASSLKCMAPPATGSIAVSIFYHG